MISPALRHDVLLRADRRRGSRPRRSTCSPACACKRSFDRIIVDGQLSTSDTVVRARERRLGVAVEPESADELRARARRWTRCCASSRSRSWPTARAPSGSGAWSCAAGADAVEPVARAVANSPLVKTALHGARPQLRPHPPGRGPGLAAGRAVRRRPRDRGPPGGVRRRRDRPRRRGAARARGGVSRRRRSSSRSRFPGEGGETEVFFSDLSEGYVRFNSSYTS